MAGGKLRRNYSSKTFHAVGHTARSDPLEGICISTDRTHAVERQSTDPTKYVRSCYHHHTYTFLSQGGIFLRSACTNEDVIGEQVEDVPEAATTLECIMSV